MSGSDNHVSSCLGQFTLTVQKYQMSGSDNHVSSCLGQFTLPVQKYQERPLSLSNFKFEYIVRLSCLGQFTLPVQKYQMSGSDNRLSSCLGQFTLPVQKYQERPLSLSNFKFEYIVRLSCLGQFPLTIQRSLEQRFTTAD